MLAQALEVVDHVSTLSTSGACPSSFVMSNNEEEVEDGEEVNQGEVPAPIVAVAPTPTIISPVLVVSSDSKAIDDLDFPSILPAISLQRVMANSYRLKKYSFEANKVIKRANALVSDLKKAMEKLVAKEEDRKANNNVAAKSKLEANVVQEELHKALQDLTELQKMAACSVYKGCLIVATAGLSAKEGNDNAAEVGGTNVSNELREEVSGE
ncbi:hypothetical protein Acr_20g0006420 [Actinidia rufa]|uniref:Uncharacterized protein n=1 Tax=Actinidia rufa TaxID=165716 RepID=A0A7J0GDI4_9ERIC|nr:hypothetical protein Acr_20g0006420 [Actinidia rufa]